jgi:uncharacterized DUF497 family protein
MLRFDWDEQKNKGNRTKHGIWFEEAQSVFGDPHGRLFYDPEHSGSVHPAWYEFRGKNLIGSSLLQEL